MLRLSHFALPSGSALFSRRAGVAPQRATAAIGRVETKERELPPFRACGLHALLLEVARRWCPRDSSCQRDAETVGSWQLGTRNFGKATITYNFSWRQMVAQITARTIRERNPQMQVKRITPR